MEPKSARCCYQWPGQNDFNDLNNFDDQNNFNDLNDLDDYLGDQ